MWFWVGVIFLFGLACGSFINVLIHRLPRGQPIGFGRSFCPCCRKPLCWWELIPILSFIYLGGRCSKCKARISWQYPMVEFATGLSFVLIFRKFIISYQLLVTGYWLLNLMFWLFVAALLIAIFVIDLEHYIIPNKLVYTGISVSFFYLLFIELLNPSAFKVVSQMSNVRCQMSDVFFPTSYFSLSFPWGNLLTTHILFSIIGAGFFWFLVLITKGKGMGMGDVKLAGLLGLVFGAKVVDVLFLAFIIGGIVGCVLILTQKKTLKSKIPFGPFLCGAALLLLCL